MSDTTHTTRFCHLFLDGADQYLFVKNLECGSYFQAQLVLHLRSGELRVRKVSFKRFNDKDREEGDSEKLLFYLQEQAARLGIKPHIVHLFSANDVPAAQKADKVKWSRVAYMPYYSGGDLFQLYESYENSGQGMPSSLILRLLKQVVCALYFMYTSGVLHADLHHGNILIHHNRALGGRPDFYITDFGAAEHGALKDPRKRYTDDLHELCIDLETWLYGGPMVEEEDRDELWRYLHDAVHTVFLSIISAPVDHLPDLKPLVDILQHAPAGPPETLPVGYGPEPEDACVPLFHTTEQDALGESDVAGPWHLAQVSIDTFTGRLKFIRVSLETYDDAANSHTWTTGSSTSVDPDQDTALQRMI